jgi:hypothetical protein
MVVLNFIMFGEKTPSSPPPLPEDGNRSSFQNVMFSGIPDDGKSPKTQ